MDWPLKASLPLDVNLTPSITLAQLNQHQELLQDLHPLSLPITGWCRDTHTWAPCPLRVLQPPSERVASTVVASPGQPFAPAPAIVRMCQHAFL